MKRFLWIAMMMLLSACSGNRNPADTPFARPVDVEASEQSILIGQGRHQFVYTLDAQSKSVIVVSTRDDNVKDTADDDDWDRTPLPAGEDPVAMVVYDEPERHQIFVADRGLNVVWGYQIQADSFPNEDALAWDVMELGTQVYQAASRPLFFNRAAQSELTLQDIVLNDITEGVESWVVRHTKNNRFEVKGTDSGEQEALARLEQTYETDDGSLSFRIQPGSREVSGSDRFYFSTLRGQPLELPDPPVDLLVDENTLYVLTQDNDALVLVDLETQQITSSFALSLSNPTRMSASNGNIYIVDDATNTYEEFDIQDQSLSTTTLTDLTDLAISHVVSVDGSQYVIGNNQNRLFETDGANTVDSLLFNRQPLNITAFDQGEGTQFLVPLETGDVEVISLDPFERVDTDEDEESGFDNKLFYDEGPRSTPELISVGTFDDRTLSERWQLVFEGVWPDLGVQSADVSGNTVTFDASVDVTNSFVQEGDWADVDGEFLEILSIDNATSITLDGSPQAQGAQNVALRAANSYIAIGSKSGLQENRVEKDTNYTSDQEEIALFIRSSLDNPVTTDDAFVFRTFSGTTPIETTIRSRAVDVLTLTKPGQSQLTGYVVYQGGGAMARINFSDLTINKIIR